MYEHGQVLHTSADFDNAMLFALPIEVWQRGKLIDQGGCIYRHTLVSVSIDDRYFYKEKCEFRVK